jgi:hypothetical protein
LGAKVALMNQEELKTRFPFMNFDDVLMGSFGMVAFGSLIKHSNSFVIRTQFYNTIWRTCRTACVLYAGLENEGAIDPWQLLSAIREKNIDLGVQYVKGDVEGFVFTRPQGFQDTHGHVPDEDADAANYRLRRMTGVIVSQIRFICGASFVRFRFVRKWPMLRRDRFAPIPL